MRRAVALAMTAVIVVQTPAAAQFAARRGTSWSAPTAARTPRPLTNAERQRSWAIDATRQAMTRIDFLPKTGGVATDVQRAVTAYAPAASGVAAGYARDWSPDDCERSIRKAEEKFGLPPYLLAAIALTESGRDERPNPFAMNIAGRTYFAAGTRDMEETVARNGGEQASIDVGCTQINLRWHAGRFRNWRSLLVPIYNAEYAAMHLRELYRSQGNWSAAVGAYHSRTPWRSTNYACLVSRRWSQIFGSVRSGCGADINAMAQLMSASSGRG